MASSDRHTYEYEVDLNDDSAPARVIRMVQPGSRVLEIGAGPGSITRHLSGTLGCDVVALEIDPSAIEKLRAFARSVYSKDLNDAAWSAELLEQEGSFDYVIAADVLEHVYDPWAVLAGMRSLLNENGSVILSLPHVGHAAVAACLVDEDFQYGDWGLLDRTHIRFFGIKNMQALLKSAGLAVEEAEFVIRTPEMTEFAHRWRRIPASVRAALELNRFSHVQQLVSRSVPVERAENDIYLMGMDVPGPEPEMEELLLKVMSGRAAPPDTDERSTFDGGSSASRGSAKAPAPDLKSQLKAFRRRLGLTRSGKR